MAATSPVAPERPVRIAYLVQQFVPEVGAGPARVSEMVRRWHDRGAAVTVVTAMPNRPAGVIQTGYRGRLFLRETWEGIPVLRSWLYARPGGGMLTTLVNNLTFMMTGLAHALRRLGAVDVIIASSPPFFPLVAGRWFASLRRTPLVLEIRDLWPDYLVEMGVLRSPVLARALLRYERRLLLSADHVVTVTAGLRDRLEAKGVPPDRLTLITNGVDLSRYYVSDEPPPFPELTRTPESFLVGYLGNFGAGQALGVVLDAARWLQERAPHIRVVMAGDGTEFQRIRARAAQSGLTNLTVRGALPKDATRAFYNACDLCLVPLADLPVFDAALPSKMFEMMACGRPILVQSRGEAAWHMRQSGAGWAVDPGDSDALATSIEAAARLPEAERREMGLRGRAYAGLHFNRDALAAKYLEVLQGLAQGGRRAE